MKRNKGNGTSPPDALDVSRAELFALMLGGRGAAPAIRSAIRRRRPGR